jgi:methionyl-tRNA formyltransferase
VCFIIGCSQMIRAGERERHVHNLVVHESAVPEGRGWSPMTWQVLEDRRRIVISLFEAVDQVDAGAIHLQTTIELTGTELIDEWRALQADATAALCTRWLDEFPAVLRSVRPQSGTPSFYARRGPADSRLDVDKSIAQQFDLLRTVDNQRYPAWFEYRGRRYRLAIELAADSQQKSSDNRS